MQLFNTLTEKKETLSPRDGETFRMFACGPTVQDNVHMGHAKTYLAFDVLKRWLLKNGVKVNFLLNITDVDDKIFDRAKRENTTYLEIADRFFGEFLKDMEALNITTINEIERVSNFVNEAMSLVQDLLLAGRAYQLDGNTYFDISQADHFGKLSHQSDYQLRMKQIDAAPGKRNSVDFLLWRKAPETATDGIWFSPTLGRGRPGWHIEDSAIAFSKFKGPYDLHGGAIELIFPHHEAELAQDEGVSGKIPFVAHWMHTGLLLNRGEKMSKSLGNDVKIREVLKEYSADEIRFYFLKRHYRDSFDYDREELLLARKALEPLQKTAAILSSSPSKSVNPGNTREMLTELLGRSEYFQKFSDAMNDDLNTPKALQIFVKLSEELSSGGDTSKNVSNLRPAFWQMSESLGFGFH